MTMCLSTVFTLKDGHESKLCEYVCNVDVNGDTIKLTDVMGQNTEVKGRLLSCDFVKNLIVIEGA